MAGPEINEGLGQKCHQSDKNNPDIKNIVAKI